MTTPPATAARTSSWPAGTPCWLDLMTPDVMAAGRFYGAVLGWHVAEPDDAHGGYVMADVAGADAAGIGPLMDGGRTGWTLYFASDDCDATAAQITGHAGQLYLPPMDVGPLGRTLIAADPTGATFGVWQAGTHVGASHVNAPGGLVWEDLRSSDPGAARAFYSAVFGLRTQPMEGAPLDYTTMHVGDDEVPAGGIGGFMNPGESGSHWLVTFGVADTDAAVTAVESAGGTVTMPAFQTPYGAMAGFKDPAGADFWVVQTDGSGRPEGDG